MIFSPYPPQLVTEFALAAPEQALISARLVPVVTRRRRAAAQVGSDA